MESIDYLFDSSGRWIAFRRGGHVFAPSGEWIGWVSAEGTAVVDVDGHYLGTLVGSDRLFRDPYFSREAPSLHPGYPGREEAPDHPGYPGRCDLPVGMEDVSLLQHA